MSTILLISGSQRASSYNTRLLCHVADRLAPVCECDLLEPLEVGLPLFDQTLEQDEAVMARVATLHARVQRSSGIVVACPEYNGLPTPYLKNLIDWISRLPYVDARYGHAFRDRPVLLCSASTGSSGGALGLEHARALFAYVGCLVVADRVCVPYADQMWVEGAYGFDPFFEAEIDDAARRFSTLTRSCAASHDATVCER